MHEHTAEVELTLWTASNVMKVCTLNRCLCHIVDDKVNLMVTSTFIDCRGGSAVLPMGKVEDLSAVSKYLSSPVKEMQPATSATVLSAPS